MTREEIDKKVKELNEVSEQIKNSTGILDPKLLRKSDQLRVELYGHWDIVKGTYSKRVTFSGFVSGFALQKVQF
jgi:hypothetical protein